MATRKTAESKKADSAREAAKKEAIERNRKKRRTYSIVLFAVGILLIAFALIGDNNIDNPEKNAWDGIHIFLYGIFGASAFFIGPAAIYASIMIARDKRKSAVIVKMLQLAAIILLVSGAVQILFIGQVGGIKEMYEKGTQLEGGGIIGMILAYPLMLFGRVGASILVVLIAFVFIMLMGNIGLVDLFVILAKPFKKAGEYARKQREIHRQEVEYVEEERRRIEENLEKDLKEEEKYAKMKAAQREIEKEIGRPVSDVFLTVDGGANSPEIAEIADESEEIELEESAEESPVPIVPIVKSPPVYITDDLEAAEIPPPFDLEPIESSTAFETALDEFKKETSEEEMQSEQRAESLEESLSESPNAEAEIPRSDFDDMALAAFMERQQMYSLPGIDLLDNNIKERSETDVQEELEANSTKLVETLNSFGVKTKIVGVIRGPSVTRYEIQPAPGVKISKITSLTDDIALNLAAAGVRMEAPIPGKSAVGVEVPNSTPDTVTFRELIDSADFRETNSNLGTAIGKAISGEIIISDIAKMPHLLIAGTTGSGKSVCVNSIIMSILYRATPDDVRLMMIDPKSVEFAIYGGIPHLLTPVITDPKKAAGALKWAVSEMTQRYSIFAENNIRNIDGYNELAKSRQESQENKENQDKNGENNENNENNDNSGNLLQPMPKIVIFIDELADLMMTAKREVEESICRLAQLARAAGIHLVIATQRPTVDVVTGLIKANVPSRIALKVASQVDSRTIIDTAGADKLLGKGDMLYAPVGMPKPVRVQGCWVSDKEVDRVVEFIKDSFDLDYDENVSDEIEKQAMSIAEKDSKSAEVAEDFDLSDDKLEDAIETVIDAGRASTSLLQTKLKLGYGRAARLIEIMEKMGVVGKFEGSKPREVLMTKQEWYERKLKDS